MTLYISRDLEKNQVWIHSLDDVAQVTLKLSEAQAIHLADQLVFQVDALALRQVLDEC